MAFVEVFDLENLFLVTFAGSGDIFAFLSIMFISTLAATFRMPTVAYGFSLVLFMLIFFNYLGGLAILMLIITGFVTYTLIARLIR